ncbi:unnamed protein product [Thlaspi arvense]|uniref:F-box domain-containing protein n=1 Tax=Thlaspi arvense TaxID=13288 RepID=A0AAU9SA94_THLAR|nr:unnamed protein product [Thlaspi arvense]
MTTASKLMSSSSKRRSLSLPFELVEAILYKVPVESLVRFKSVCKQWYTFFNDKIFIYKHLDLYQERFIGFNQTDPKSTQIFNPETNGILRLPTPDELHSYTFSGVLHSCDGLLLCVCVDRCTHGNDKYRKLVVWNPILSQIKLIEPSSSYNEFDIYGFGYDIVSRDNYKVLRISKEYYKDESSEIEIYEFKSKRWRCVDATLECDMWASVSIYRNMYWLAQKRMGTECSLSLSNDQTVRVLLSSFGGDKLSLLHQDIHMEIDVWVTNKLTDGIVSWSKYYNVIADTLILHSSSHHNVLRTHFIHKTNKIMLWCEELDVKMGDSCTSIYQMGDGYEIKKQVAMTERSKHKYCDVYVPSVVPVPK